jgi:hypothetical protein
MGISGLGMGIRLKVILVVFLLADEVLHFLMVACFVKKNKELLIKADCVWLLSFHLVHVNVKSGQSLESVSVPTRSVATLIHFDVIIVSLWLQ